MNKKKLASAFNLRLTSLYLHPLIKQSGVWDANPAEVLRKLKSALLRKVRDKLKQTAFSMRAKAALSKALKVEVKPSSIMLYVRHPAWIPLVQGQQGGQMTWLTKAKAPIPIITEKGELIFRSATAKSMADGKWVHPGREPSNFLDKARKEARQFVAQKVVEDMRRQLRNAWVK